MHTYFTTSSLTSSLAAHPLLQAVLNLYPYHIDSLLQLSEVCRMTEDYQMGADLIGLCIYSRISVSLSMYVCMYIQNICAYI